MAEQKTITCIRRLMAEAARVRAESSDIGFYGFPIKDNDDTWEIYIKGSPDSPYDGCFLHARMEFPWNYPMDPPSMTFVTKMFHPNIYPNGKVCVSILHAQDDDPTDYERPEEKWTPVLSICTIVLSVVSLLNDPNTASPANVDASKMLNDNKNQFYTTAREMALKNGVQWDQIPLNELTEIDQKHMKLLFGKMNSDE